MGLGRHKRSCDYIRQLSYRAFWQVILGIGSPSETSVKPSSGQKIQCYSAIISQVILDQDIVLCLEIESEFTLKRVTHSV